jgi:hypothetical protein
VLFRPLRRSDNSHQKWFQYALIAVRFDLILDS